MRPALRRLFLSAVTTDSEASPDVSGWHTRCLHCRTRLHVGPGGEPLGAASLEHVVPRAWFGKRAAAALTARVGDAPDDARNLAIACTRCNHDKGKGPDARGPQDSRAHEVVEALLSKRLARWRDAPSDDRDGID
ncbi:HNH endonuclease [Cognatilysobacter bugurensis]|uniref:HNH endonuclease n=1 Tax=Cognatilysobacter bugurensis TaxID=543356 RepID=A0A918SUI3_9GAMM|nr:HNH endonuclease [Lysobacter bugurensis]GHA68230.1 HNH endonuclease [Lysobacter bugurensis]